MNVTLERRVRRLEKQVIILKAKIKANDLWKLQLQTWIYKKFKKLIVDQVPCSASSSGESSEDSENEVEKEGSEDEEFRPRVPPRKKTRVMTSSSGIRRAGGRRRIAITNIKWGNRANGTAQVSERVPSDSTSQSVARANTPPGLSDLDVKAEVLDADNTSERAASDKTSRNNGQAEGNDRSTGDVIESSCHDRVASTTENLPRRSTEETSTSTADVVPTKIHIRDSPCILDPRHKQAGEILEVRPDLQKYFQFIGSPDDEDGLKVACLVQGCNSILRINLRTKWSNPVRHLAGVHKIAEYIEHAPSAVASRSSQRH